MPPLRAPGINVVLQMGVDAMSTTAKKSDPKLWDEVKAAITAGDKGGKPGQWSARKAQISSTEYQKRGGGYAGGKRKDNHLQGWTDEEWGTKSGEESEETGERYLPKDAREALSDTEYKRTSDKKRADNKKGKQFSAQPDDIAAKTAELRETSTVEGRTRADLYKAACKQDINGRSKMSKVELEKALAH